MYLIINVYHGGGCFKGGKTAAVVRGPIVSRVINQLVAGTVWGELDYLVVNIPPG